MTATSSPSKSLSPEFWVGLLSPAIVGFALLIATPLIVLNAWVLTKLWGWYIVPAFHLEPLSMIYAFGLSLIVGHMTHQTAKNDIGFWKILGTGLTKSLVALAVGWVGTFFI